MRDILPESRMPETRHAAATPEHGLGLVRGSWSWPAMGWLSGGLGALVVAVFFLIVDLLASRPLWTPTALGSALFLGKRIRADAEPVLEIVAGYTGIHFLTFAGVGLLTTLLLSKRPHQRSPWAMIVVAGALYVALELFFAGFALLAPELRHDLGGWRVSAANALAAITMALFIGVLSGRERPDVAK